MIQSVSGALRLSFAVVFFLAGLLAVFEPPTYSLWKLSIVVKEGGHFLVAPCLLLAWLHLRAGRAGAWIAALLFASSLLFSATFLRAIPVAGKLEREFSAGWEKAGDSLRPPSGRLRRTKALSFADLFKGVPEGGASFETFAYARKDGRDLRLDFYAPARPAPDGAAARIPAPCVIVVHGGGWDGGDRAQLSPLNGFLASEGYAVAALQYRLAPRYRYPAPVEDVADAIAWLRARADSLAIDPDRLALLGRSAGGQIALNAAYTLKDPGVKGVVAFYAPADMVFGYGLPTSPLILDSRKLMRQYLGGGYDSVPDAYAASSPVEHLGPGCPPTLLLHGRPDVLVSFRHTAHMRDKMRALGLRCFVVDLPWAAHGYDFIFRGPGSQIGLYFVERFLAEVTRELPKASREGGAGTFRLRAAGA
jgi:acetyl esterase/lipase